jgi:hypothetical protein
MICLSFAGDGSIALTSRTSRGARAQLSREGHRCSTPDPECE